MVLGRVVRFDNNRGYGFIAPENGQEDVFLHVNDLLIPESCIRSGLAVEFEVEDGGRGLKASSIRLAPAPRPVPAPAAVPAQRPSPALPQARPTAPETASEQERDIEEPADEALCDVLSADEHGKEVTELLLEVGDLTGDQIVRVRQALLQFAKGHGWIDG